MNWINQITVLFCCQFIIGAGVTTTSAQAQTFSNSPQIAQTVVDTLPAPPLLNQAKKPQDEVFVPRDLDFRVPESPIAQKVDSYLVYINDADSTLLEQVKQSIPTAFRRQFQGKSVIQAGVFGNALNAISLAQKLQSFGIASHVFNLTTTKEVALTTNKSQLYSVVVPTKVER